MAMLIIRKFKMDDKNISAMMSTLVNLLIVLSLVSYETSAQENLMEQCRKGEKFCKKVEGFHNGVYTNDGNKAFIHGSGVDEGNINSGNKNNTGHQKPFGQSGSQTPIPEISGFPKTNFFLEYFFPSIPVLMKGAALISPAFHKWTDDYMLRMASLRENKKVLLDIEKGKKENRGDEGLSMSFYDFLKSYNDSDMYLVSDADTLAFMNPFLMLPCPLQCPELAKAQVSTRNVMWMSSGGTKSVVHTDGEDNINCLYRGNKTLYMLDPVSISTGSIVDITAGHYSLMDVDRVDLNRYPTLRGANFVVAHMTPGDCLYIPKGWIHQVQSFGSNLAANVWFQHQKTLEVLQKGYCSNHNLPCDPTFTLGRVTFPDLPDKSDSDEVEFEYLILFFEYCSVRGEASVSPDDPPMTKAEEKVKVEEFIRGIVKYQLHPFTKEDEETQEVGKDQALKQEGESEPKELEDKRQESEKEQAETLKEFEVARKRSLILFCELIRGLDDDNDGVLTSSEFTSGLDEMWEIVIQMVKRLAEMKKPLPSSKNDVVDVVDVIYEADDIESDVVVE